MAIIRMTAHYAVFVAHFTQEKLAKVITLHFEIDNDIIYIGAKKKCNV